MGLDFKTNKNIVELGPGTGAITTQIIQHMGEYNNFLGIELNEKIHHYVSMRFPQHKIILDNAVNLPQIIKKENIDPIDIVISGLPWAIFPGDLQDQILSAIVQSLKDEGIFSTFAYIHGYVLPAAKRFKHKLYKHFSKVEKSSIIWKNIPPAYVYKCTK